MLLENSDNIMEFENFYFKNEVRDGFFIPGMIKRSWAMQMEVLQVVRKICDNHNLKWFAIYGTLIGAVRHRGFIPWDDDLDICMLRDDYAKFLQIAKSELSTDFNLSCIEETEGYNNFLVRITKGTSVSVNIDHLNKNHGFPYCAGIDIFPLDYLYEDKDKEKEQITKINQLVDYYKIDVSKMNHIEKEMLTRKIEAVSGYAVDKSISLQDALIRIIDRLHKEAPKEGAKRVAMMYFYANNGSQVYPIDYFAQSIEVPFETTTICISPQYDAILSQCYGNWGVANRMGGLHDYPFFHEHETILLKENGSVPYRFKFALLSSDEKKKREKHYLSCDRNANILATIHSVHETMRNLIAERKWNDATSLCCKCQELAVWVGNSIETTFDSKTRSKKLSLISALEEYCEDAYKLYEILSGEIIDIAMEQNSRMIESLSQLTALYNNKCRENNQVLFLPIHVNDWNALLPLYQDELAKQNVDGSLEIYVMPLPYYERMDDGNMGDAHWDFNFFANDLPLVDYHQVKIEQFHFRTIYFVDPYDSYQSGMTVDTSYYSEKLYQICDELILVDSLIVSNPLDEKTMENLKHYVFTPGVMRADRMIVPDADTKAAFEKILCDGNFLAGEHSILVDERIKEQWRNKRGHTEKKKLLFYTSISDFYGYPDKVFDWLDSRMEVLEESKDRLHILWVAPIGLQNLFLKDYPELQSVFKTFMEKIQDKCGASVISEYDVEEQMDEFDAFYGSPGYLMNQCAQRKLPIMIRNMDL